MPRYSFTLNLDGETAEVFAEMVRNYRDVYQARLNEYNKRLRTQEGLSFQDTTDRERFDRTTSLHREFATLVDTFAPAIEKIKADRINDGGPDDGDE